MCQRGSNFDNVFFLDDEGREDPNTTIGGLFLARERNAISMARKQNAISMAFCWRVDDGPTLNIRGSGPVLLGNPIFLLFFGGFWVLTPCLPVGSAHGYI